MTEDPKKRLIARAAVKYLVDTQSVDLPAGGEVWDHADTSKVVVLHTDDGRILALYRYDPPSDTFTFEADKTATMQTLAQRMRERQP
jgi:hypothetical protein